MPEAASIPTSETPPRSAHVGWRLLALFYDVWPVAALWMIVAVPFVVVDAVVAGNARHNIAPFSVAQVVLWFACWVVTGLYATVSWRRGGQTLGMRPWRLRVVDAAGGTPTTLQLWQRFAVGTASLLLGGLGFWWSWVDREGLAWHDRASGTRMIRMPKRQP